MAKLGTFCSECCFYDNEKKDCVIDCHSSFKARNAEFVWEEDGPKIDRVCPYRRTKEWEVDKSLSERATLVREEVYIKGTIILQVGSIEDLDKTLEILSKVPKIDNFKILISHTFSTKSSDVKRVCEGKLDFAKYCCISHVEDSTEMQTYRSLKEVQNGYVFVLDCSKDFDASCIEKLNHFIYKKLFRVLHVEGLDGTTHQSVTLASVYKWLKGDTQCQMGQKLKEVADFEEGDSLVVNWKEIHEEYSN